MYRSSAILVLSAALIGFAAWRTPRMHPDNVCCDHFFYRAMADRRPEWSSVQPGTMLSAVYHSPVGSRFLHAENALYLQPPYCYRILTPTIVRALSAGGVSLNNAFYAVSVAGLVLTGWGIGMLVLHTAPLWCALCAVVAFGTHTAAVHVNLYDFMLVDALTYAGLAWGIYCLAVGRRVAFFAIVLLGALNKEIVLALLPCAVLYEWRRLAAPPWHIITASGSLIASYALFRWSVPVPVNTYSPAAAFVGLPPQAWADFWGVFGALGVLALMRCWRRREAWAFVPLLAAVAVASVCASDTLRVYLLAFPAFTAMAAVATTPLGIAGPFVLLVAQRLAGVPAVAVVPTIVGIEIVDRYWARSRRPARFNERCAE